MCAERPRPNFFLVKDSRPSFSKAKRAIFSDSLSRKILPLTFSLSLCQDFTLFGSLSLFGPQGAGFWQHHTEKIKLKSQSVCEMVWCLCSFVFVCLPFSLPPLFSTALRMPPSLSLPPISISPTFYCEDSKESDVSGYLFHSCLRGSFWWIVVHESIGRKKKDEKQKNLINSWESF